MPETPPPAVPRELADAAEPGPEAAAEIPPVARRAWFRRPLLGEALVVLMLLGVLSVVVFGDYIFGDVNPQFDFYGTYNAEAFAWWRDGSFLHPLQWMPYTWAGYPQAVALQSSAWYLPTGLTVWLLGLTSHVAAVLQVVHVCFGALGVYVLARVWGVGRAAATVGLVAGFFLPGFYANAQHIDIVRGYAWAPWILLMLSSRWPWRRWWAVPVAAFALFQALVAVYPGMVVAFGYIGAVFVLTEQVLRRPKVRDYLLPLAVTVACGGLMSTLKFVPGLLVRGAVDPGVDFSVFDWGILGTVFFPYDGNLPSDPSMRSYFVPATCVVLLALVPWRDARARAGAVVVVASALVSLPVFPWFHALNHLPAFDISRFRFSDYRPLLISAVLLLAVLGLDKFVRADAVRRASGEVRRLAWRHLGSLATIAFVVVGAGAIGVLRHFGSERWAGPWTILVAAALVVVLVAGVGSPRWPIAVPDARALAAVLVALTAVSGVTWAYAVPITWRADRVQVEMRTFGATIYDLISVRDHGGGTALKPAAQRPARTPLTQDPVPFIESQNMWNSAYYTGNAAVGGYANLKGNEAFTRAVHAFQNAATTHDARAFYAAPGIVLAGSVDRVPTTAQVDACVGAGQCGGIDVTPIAYRPGHLQYDVRTPGGPVQLNEAMYKGWVATLCARGGASCTDLPLTMSAVGTIAADLPAGDWSLTLDYRTPGLALSWVLFWSSGGVALAWACGVWLLERLGRPRRARRGGRPVAGTLRRSRDEP